MIQRHIGNKDELVRAVLASHSQVDAKHIARAADLETASAWMFGHLDTGADEVALLAAMALVNGWAVLKQQLVDAFGSDLR